MQCLISVTVELKQSVVDKAIDQWRRRLQTRVRDKGQHFVTLNSCVTEMLLYHAEFYGSREPPLHSSLFIDRMLSGRLIALDKWSGQHTHIDNLSGQVIAVDK